MYRFRLRLEPLDVLMFRDSRPFGEASRASRSELPTPRAVAGALRTWLLGGLGVDLAALRTKEVRRRLQSGETTLLAELSELAGEDTRWVLAAQFLGPFFEQHGSPFLPIPRHLAAPYPEASESEWLKLRPNLDREAVVAMEGAPAGFRNCDAGGYQAWTELGDQFLGDSHFQSALTRLPTLLADRRATLSHLASHEARVGLEVVPGARQGKEGRLYTQSYLRPRRGVALRVDLRVDQDVGPVLARLAARRPLLRLGGEGRMARVRLVASAPPLPSGGAWPPPEGKFLTVLATPALWSSPRWYPAALAERFELVGALVGAPAATSGWDVARNLPTRTRFAVPAGAVHFWRVRPGSDPGDDPHETVLADAAQSDAGADLLAGWGVVMRGEWPEVRRAERGEGDPA